MTWVKIRSWHALRPHDPFGPTTYCGRDAEGREGREVWDELPADKSCEVCLRLLARLADDASAE